MSWSRSWSISVIDKEPVEKQPKLNYIQNLLLLPYFHSNWGRLDQWDHCWPYGTLLPFIQNSISVWSISCAEYGVFDWLHICGRIDQCYCDCLQGERFHSSINIYRHFYFNYSCIMYNFCHSLMMVYKGKHLLNSEPCIFFSFFFFFKMNGTESWPKNMCTQTLHTNMHHDVWEFPPGDQ